MTTCLIKSLHEQWFQRDEPILVENWGSRRQIASLVAIREQNSNLKSQTGRQTSNESSLKITNPTHQE